MYPIDPVGLLGASFNSSLGYNPYTSIETASTIGHGMLVRKFCYWKILVAQHPPSSYVSEVGVALAFEMGQKCVYSTSIKAINAME